MGRPGSPLLQSGAGLAQGVATGSLLGGRYRVIRPLKSGGMGSVFEAERQGTHRRVALKVIRPELVADPEARRRFETEARLSAVLASRHVVDVLDAGIDDATGVPFIACPGAYWVQVAAPADATPDNYEFAITRKAIVGRPELAGCCFVMARNPVGQRIFG